MDCFGRGVEEIVDLLEIEEQEITGRRKERVLQIWDEYRFELLEANAD